VLRKAKRNNTKVRIALKGISGAGKTYGALLLAKGILGSLDKVTVIDTEFSSSDLYADLGNFSVLTIKSPYHPEKFISAIQECEKANSQLIIIDSLSSEWQGTGGILDIHAAMTGNSFTNWSKVNALHEKFIEAILNSNCHVVATIRSKQGYVLNPNKEGKLVPEKIGLKAIARETTDYDFTIVMELNNKHQCSISKDRTGLFKDLNGFTISDKTGCLINEWCSKPSPTNINEFNKTLNV
jgi:hypothetical protein